ncbi:MULTISPECIES: DMT family transporter [Thermus]|jgi:drug/metabolite transporter (DMT)-like permease|uniref:EamA-like transporter family n=1 Tax=Thermus oshimai JL-2 TaxID=751945 RepID=K7R7W5_THEOS|nr:DMT family transporter [Thermus oshimai]AFV77124.1 EamA-like transporter family [Thermus oshimai JL-2]
MRPSGAKLLAVLLLGILAISFGSILVRLALGASGDASLAFSLVMSAGRLTLAALLLLPGWRRPAKGEGVLWALGAGAFLALHFAFWITSLSYTSVAASTALVTTNPVWVTLLGWLLFRERPTPLTLLGVGVALSGGLLIGLGDAQGGGGKNPLLGDLLALLGAVAVSFYFLLGREAQRRGLSTLEYIRFAYTAAALLLLPLPYLFGGGYGGYPLPVYLYILLMALIPQLIGHTSFNWATRHISPVLVTLAILFEPVGASLLAFLLFGEVPGPLVLLGALVLLVGVGLAVLGGRR